MRLQLSSGAYTDICVSVTIKKPLGFMFILGMNGIKAFGGITVDTQGGVCFDVEETGICAIADTMVGVDELILVLLAILILSR